MELIEMALKRLLSEEEEGGGEDTEYNKSSSAAAAANSSEDEEKFVAVVDEDEHRRSLLTKLLSQVETLKAEGKLVLPGTDTKESSKAEAVDGSTMSSEEIVRELNRVKRQNFITHCLLSAMIVLTVAWQISEVSLILKLKDGISHPFKSIGGAVFGMFRRPKPNGREEDRESSANLHEPSPLPDLKMPDLAHMGLPSLDFSCDNDE